MTPQMMAKRVAALIKANGNTVILPDGSTPKAVPCVTEKDIQKYVTSDGADPGGRGKVVAVFVFDGSMIGKINPGDTLTWQNVRYCVQTPMYPRMKGDVGIELAVACFAP